jgi:hypothetical protein
MFIIPYLYEAQQVLGDTAHHQGPKTALAASGFSYMEGCWTCGWWTLYTSKQPSTYDKPEAASAVLGS